VSRLLVCPLLWLTAMKQHSSTPSRRLDELLPGAQFRDTIDLVVHAPRPRIFRAAREVTLADMPLARVLGELRYLPGLLTGHRAGTGAVDAPFFDELTRTGNLVLAEEPDREIVVGMIGRLHQVLDQEPVRLDDRAAFARFDEPGYEKLAMSLRIEGDDAERGCLLVLEHRTLALDPFAEKRFGQYWLVIKPMGAFVTGQLLRAIRRRAGAPDRRGPDVPSSAQSTDQPRPA
jgi:hypothetical protein